MIEMYKSKSSDKEDYYKITTSYDCNKGVVVVIETNQKELVNYYLNDDMTETMTRYYVDEVTKKLA